MLDPANMSAKKLAHVLDECLGNVRKEKGIEPTDHDNVDCRDFFCVFFDLLKMSWSRGLGFS